MKILLDGTSLYDRTGAGIHVYAKNLIRHLADYLSPEELHVGVRPSRWKYLSQFDYPYIVRRILTFHFLGYDWGIAGGAYSCYHGLSNRVHWLLYPPRVKHVVTIHHLEDEKEVKRAKRFQSYVDAVITVSYFSQREIAQKVGIPLSKIHVIYNGLSPIFHPLPNGEREMLKERYVGKREKMVLIPITGDTIKNQKNVVEVVRYFSQHHSGVHFLSFGIQEFPYLSHLGYVSEEDLVRLYNAADIVFFPAISGGFGLPIIEAMACGTPVITSSLGAQAEVGYDAALLANPYSVKEMIEAIETLLINGTLRRSLIQKGFNRIQLFDWGRAARQLVSLYQELSQGSF